MEILFIGNGSRHTRIHMVKLVEAFIFCYLLNHVATS
jgi:hypothetical protein